GYFGAVLRFALSMLSISSFSQELRSPENPVRFRTCPGSHWVAEATEYFQMGHVPGTNDSGVTRMQDKAGDTPADRRR
ncbi:hypothetical protein QCE47_28085, partial [Caballeronia sp. LZ025]|uniref:hypothetical protein n=1 Tax=Caballeronia sp. LZ025 TaxID=3038562 RepID=UPI002866D5AE